MNEKPASASLEFSAEIRFLPAAVDFTKQFFASFSDICTDEQFLYNLQLAISEALTNVMKHAYPENMPGQVTLSLFRKGGTVIMIIKDKGFPFNPTNVPEPDLDNPQGHGLGMFFLRELMDSVEYSRSGITNTLTLTKAIPPCER